MIPDITPGRLCQLHAEAIRRWQGNNNPTPKEGCLEGAIGNARAGVMYETDADEPDPLRVAVYLFVYLAKNHCFADGNKRVAWMALMDYLAVLDLSLVAREEEVELFVCDIAAAKGATVDAAHEWIGQRLVVLDRA